ncbi:MAG: DUF5839 family protein [Clostridium paraputrificum]
MKLIEGFHIGQIKRGRNKGQERINYKVRYRWNIPERLEGKIKKGDIVWVHCKKGDKDFIARVLVIDIIDSNERVLRSVINIAN